MIKPESEIGIAGAGTMGLGIAQVAAAAGHPVWVYDNDGKALERARTLLSQTLDKLVSKNKMSADQAKGLLSRIQWIDRVGKFAACDLVIEAVVEDLSVKRELLTSIAGVVGADCLLSTNTSSLSVTSVAVACPHPARVLGLHFFNPAPVMPLVEIVPGLETEESLTGQARKLMKQWGKVPVVAKDMPGFIVNRIARPFYGEALRIYEEGLAGFAAIDRAMKEAGGFRMGPFELMDLIGNDVNYRVTVSVWEQLYYDPRYRPSVIQRRMVEAGRLGRKSGRGYFEYGPEAVEVNKVASIDDAVIFMRILSMLVNEAADALYCGLAGRDDIELAMTKGVNYPKGLLRWADEIGVQKIYDTLCRLRSDYREDRYRPSVLLKRMAEGNERFFS